MTNVIECIDCVNTQVGELCIKAAQCSLPVQQLQKRLILFRHHLEEVIPTAIQQLALPTAIFSEDSSKTTVRNVTNKQQLDRSNAKQKWYLIND